MTSKHPYLCIICPQVLIGSFYTYKSIKDIKTEAELKKIELAGIGEGFLSKYFATQNEP